MICRRMSDSTTSDKVDLNDSIRLWGRFFINPTVSEISTFFGNAKSIFLVIFDRFKSLVEVSRVAKSLSST